MIEIGGWKWGAPFDWSSRLLVATILFISSQALLAQTSPARRASVNDRAEGGTGPEIGQKIPLFRASDQHGKLQDFNSIRGPKGAMIVFFRSADW